jgi:hypothetical protein
MPTFSMPRDLCVAGPGLERLGKGLFAGSTLTCSDETTSSQIDVSGTKMVSIVRSS